MRQLVRELTRHRIRLRDSLGRCSTGRPFCPASRGFFLPARKIPKPLPVLPFGIIRQYSRNYTTPPTRTRKPKRPLGVWGVGCFPCTRGGGCQTSSGAGACACVCGARNQDTYRSFRRVDAIGWSVMISLRKHWGPEGEGQWGYLVLVLATPAYFL